MANLKKDTYFVNSKNEVFFLEKGTPSSFIQSDFKEIKESEVEDLVNTFEVVQNRKLSEINSIKVKLINIDIVYNGNTFANSEKDRNLILNTISLYKTIGELPKGFVWISKDNKQIEVSLQDLINIANLMQKNLNSITIKARKLKDDILLCKTKKDLEKIVWE